MFADGHEDGYCERCTAFHGAIPRMEAVDELAAMYSQHTHWLMPQAGLDILHACFYVSTIADCLYLDGIETVMKLSAVMPIATLPIMMADHDYADRLTGVFTIPRTVCRHQLAAAFPGHWESEDEEIPTQDIILMGDPDSGSGVAFAPLLLDAIAMVDPAAGMDIAGLLKVLEEG